MGKSSGMTRGDRRRNARAERLRGLLPRDGAVAGIDLGEDKQAIAVIDHDVRVLWRKTVRVKAHQLGEVIDRAVEAAMARGHARVTVACEPTGARWMQVQRLCAERGLAMVCIQPLVSHIAREQQDYTTHKRDEPDSVLIGRLAAELHCYVPEVLDEAWAHLRHLGRRRAQLITAATASVLRVRDFLSVAWPAAGQACAHPFKSVTWLAAVQQVTARCGGQPEQLAAIGEEAFAEVVQAAVAGWGGRTGGSPGRCSPRWPTARTRSPGPAAACSAASPTSWATCSAPARSCARWKRTWPRCWASWAWPGWRTSPG